MKNLWILLFFLVIGCSQSSGPRLHPQSGINPPNPDITPPQTDFTAQETLGETIFHDTNLSEPPGVSCISCHNPASAFTGNNGSTIPGVALGSTPGSFGLRNVPTILYTGFIQPFAFYPSGSENPNNPTALIPMGGQFWDGRAGTLSDQVQGPLLNSNEMNNPDKAAVITKIQNASYVDLFKHVCGEDIFNDVEEAFSCLSHAVAAFEQTSTFKPFTSKFDAYLRGTTELTATEAQGMALFIDPNKGNCISCHTGHVDSNYPLNWPFTDHGYDSIGIPRNTAIPANADPGFFDLGLCTQPGLAAIAPPGFDISKLCTTFKTPTLRNIALTAPYGHNGQFLTLTDIVSFYATRDTDPDLWYPVGQKFNDSPVQYHANINVQPPFDLHQGDTPHLDSNEVAAIVAFLNTLTDGYSK